MILAGRRLRGGAPVALGLVLLALAGLALWFSPVQEDLDPVLDLWRPTPPVRARLAALRALRREVAVPVDAGRRLEEAWREANTASWSGDGPGVPRAPALESRFRSLAQEIIRDHGAGVVAAVGTTLSDHFLEALGRVEGLAGDEVWSRWLGAHAGDPAVQELRALGGDLPERSFATGLLPARGPADPDRLLVAQILWFSHWCEAARKGLARELVSPEEQLLLRLWKVEDSERLSFARRRQVMDEVRLAAPGYPADFVLGVLAAREGLMDEAREHLAAARDAGYEPALVGRWMAWVERQSPP
ncbi:MAG: hypothetical protein FJ098_05485 [Deltaproteobacteria bacterium]|nr:hypothetical protein [Deltaproteobacteria bacterium]